MKTSVGPTVPLRPRDARAKEDGKTKGRPKAASFDTRSYRGSAAHIGVFLPSLYVYRVVAAFFSSPLPSNWMLAVTPL